MRAVQDHAVADVALDAWTHDAAGNQVERGFHAIDDQGVTRIVAALKAHHAASAFGQPIDQFAFAFVTPLGADDDHIATDFLNCVATCIAHDSIF